MAKHTTKMKITYPELLKIVKSEPDKKRLKQLLKYIFSFKENLDIFSYFFFPDAATSKIPKFHYELYDWLFNENDGAIAAPRGHAKSTTVGLFFLVFCVVNKLEEYIVYISQNFQKTVQFIEPLSMTFSTNEQLRWVYGDLTPGKERDDSGKYRQDIIDVNGIRIQAASFDGNIRGFKYKYTRPTLIILDDVEADDRVLNPELRLRDEYKLNKIIIPSLNPEHGKVKMVGTILHWDSLLVKKIRLYNGVIYKAIDEQGQVLWPEYWSKEKLMEKKKSIGSVSFSSEFLNNPIENEAGIIKKEWLDQCKDYDLSYEDSNTNKYERKILGCDFAFGDRVVNDKSAFVGVGEKKGLYYLTHLSTYKGMSITEQFEIIEQLYLKDRYDEVSLEENSIKSLSKELFTYRFQYYLIWTGATDTASKLKEQSDFTDKRHTVGKRAMILRLATKFENKTVRMPYKTDNDKKLTDSLIAELLTFALNDGKLVEVGIHADIPIGLGMALERMNSDETIIDW